MRVNWMLGMALAVLAMPAAAQRATDRPSSPLPTIGNRGEADGFKGMLLVTPDADWKEKWNTPSSITPHFTIANDVAQGGKLFVLTFLANPGVDGQGMANVTCDLEVVRPDGTRSSFQDGVDCFKAKLQGPPTNVYLAAPVVVFTGDPGDPAGVWTVRVTLRDNVRHVNVPLEAAFELK
jgi:hypothetical protein